MGYQRLSRVFLIFVVLSCVVLYVVQIKNRLPSPHRVHPSNTKNRTLYARFPSPEPPIRRWIVVIGKNVSCEKLTLKFVNWMVLMIDGRKQQTRNSKCVFLDFLDNQRRAERRQSRLYEGYLYAIQHGAEVIFPITMGTCAHTLENLKHSTTIGLQTGLVSPSGGIMFDASIHFGCNISFNGNRSSSLTYSLCHRKVAAIQAAASCSRIQPPDSSGQESTCDIHAPSVALANDHFIPIHLEDALYTKDAFWALPGIFVSESVERFELSLLVQRLLWLSGNQIVVKRCRSSLNETESLQLLNTATQLNNWHCSATNLKQCIVDLFTRYYGQNSVITVYRRWLDDLQEYGYVFPQFSQSFNEICEPVTLHAVDHYVPLLRRPDGGSVYTPITNIDSIKILYNDTCHSSDVLLPKKLHINFAQPWIQFDDILVLVIFNNPHYESISYFETLYRPFFPNILYCGPGELDVNLYPRISKFTFSFVSFGSNVDGYVAGAFTQKCMAIAMQMDYSVKGYLSVADDLFIVVHTLAKLNKNVVWFEKNVHVGDLNKFTECKAGICNVRHKWGTEHWWKLYRNESFNVLADLKHMINSSNVVNTCYQRLLEKNGAADRANAAFSDIYYIPVSRSQDFLELVQIFLHHNVMVEIAVPMIIRCFAEAKYVHPLLGAKWRGPMRNQPWKLIDTKNLVGQSFFHPVKWGFLSRGSAKYISLYCNSVLPFLHDHSAGKDKPKPRTL